MADKNWQKIKFYCSKCGQESWMEIDINSYIIKIDELICDDCNPVEGN